VFTAIAWPVAEKLGVARMPGDIVVDIGTRLVTIPFVSSLILAARVGAGIWALKR
jgi:hypothetical protein